MHHFLKFSEQISEWPHHFITEKYVSSSASAIRQWKTEITSKLESEGFSSSWMFRTTVTSNDWFFSCQMIGGYNFVCQVLYKALIKLCIMQDWIGSSIYLKRTRSSKQLPTLLFSVYIAENHYLKFIYLFIYFIKHNRQVAEIKIPFIFT